MRALTVTCVGLRNLQTGDNTHQLLCIRLEGTKYVAIIIFIPLQLYSYTFTLKLNPKFPIKFGDKCSFLMWTISYTNIILIKIYFHHNHNSWLKYTFFLTHTIFSNTAHLQQWKKELGFSHFDWQKKINCWWSMTALCPCTKGLT